MKEALADFLRHLALERNASELTVKSYREDLTQAVAFFAEKAPDISVIESEISSHSLTILKCSSSSCF